MTIDSYVSFIVQSIIVTALPGPTMLLIMHYSMQYGKLAGRFTAPGVVVGDIVALILTFMGLGALLQISPGLFSTLKIIGGLYFIALGVAAMRFKEDINEKIDEFHKPPGRRLFTHMIIVNAFNPQSIIFLLAFFPQFISPKDDYLYQFLIMGIGYAAVGGGVAIIFNLMAYKISTWIKKPSVKRYIGLTSGAMLCGIGVLTIFF